MDDSGANGIAFIDRSFAHDNDLLLEPLRTPRRLEVVDGRQSVAGQITHITRLAVQVKGHKEVLPCFITKLGQQPMIGAAAFVRLADRARKAPKSYQVFAVSLRDVERALAPKVTIDPRDKLPKEYHEFLSVFSRQEADKLPPHCSYDHKIQLKE